MLVGVGARGRRGCARAERLPLATTTTLLGAALAPLVVGGVLARGGWPACGRRAPARDRSCRRARRPGRVGAPGRASSAALLPPSRAASGARPGVVAAFVVVGSAAALLAGARRAVAQGGRWTTRWRPSRPSPAIAIAARSLVGARRPAARRRSACRISSSSRSSAARSSVAPLDALGRRLEVRPMIAATDTIVLAPGVALAARQLARRGARRLVAAERERCVRRSPARVARSGRSCGEIADGVLALRTRQRVPTCSASPGSSTLSRSSTSSADAVALRRARRLAPPRGAPRTGRCAAGAAHCAGARSTRARPSRGRRRPPRGRSCSRVARGRGVAARRRSPARGCSPGPPGSSSPLALGLGIGLGLVAPRGGPRRLAPRGSERARRARPPHVRPPRAGRCLAAVARRAGGPRRRRGARSRASSSPVDRSVAPILAIAGCPSAPTRWRSPCRRRREDRMRALKAFLLGAARRRRARLRARVRRSRYRAGGRSHARRRTRAARARRGRRASETRRRRPSGAGSLVLALLGGLVNLAAARLIRRRAEAGPIA